MNMEIIVQLNSNNKKFELDILHATQASQEHVAALFADVIRSRRCDTDNARE